MILIHALAAVLLFFVQTPQATPTEDQNAFIQLATEHCATEIALAAYENTGEQGEVPATPAFVTYAAYDFESADQANTALDAAPLLVAQTYSDDQDIDEADTYDELVTEVPTGDYGDRAVAHIMNLPDEDSDDDVLTIEMLGIVKDTQLLLVLMFGEGGASPASPGVELETVPPFGEDLDEMWDGQGDIADAIPTQDEFVPGWEGQEITTGEIAACE